MYLIDLIHEGEGCTGFFCQTHKIQNCGQGSFLLKKKIESEVSVKEQEKIRMCLRTAFFSECENQIDVLRRTAYAL